MAKSDRRKLESVARPKQARSEDTLYRILDAAEVLIQEKGLADASIPEIVRRAGSSVGGFYGRFKDKNELLRTLEERFFQRMELRLEALADPERWGDASVAEIASAGMAELVRTSREQQGLILAFAARSTSDPSFREDGLRFRRRVERRMGELLLQRPEVFSHPEPALAIDFGIQLAFGLVFQVLILGDSFANGRRLRDEELVAELTLNFIRYVGASD